MKIYTVYQVTVLKSWVCFFGTMLIIALMLSATAFPQSSPTPVNVGTPGDFVILSKTGTTSTEVTSITGDIEFNIASPLAYSISQNYPNPFNPTITIRYRIIEESNVKIILFNAIGEKVAVVLNEEKESGYHQKEFNAASLPGGVYFYQLQAGDFVGTRKMILLK